jgi:putative flippase GtrA
MNGIAMDSRRVMDKRGRQVVDFTQFIRFSAAGAVGTGMHYVVLIVAVQQFQVNAVTASVSGALIGAIVNYLLNYHFTFWSSKRHREALAKFIVVAATGFLINGLLMYLLINSVNLHYLLSQVLTTFIVLFWNFIGNKAWSFRE